MKKSRFQIKQEIIQEARSRINRLHGDISDEIASEMIEEAIFDSSSCRNLDMDEIHSLFKETFYALRSELDVLTPFVEDPDITEIMVNGPDTIFIERNGSIERADYSFDSPEALEEVIRRIAAGVHREINEMNPILDARLANGSRVNAVYKNIALGGPSVTIRKFPETALTMEDLISYGTITREAADYLSVLIKAGYNIFISGGTSSGKTTFLNVLSKYIPESERVICIEDSAELQLGSIRNLVRMECRNANVHGKGEVNMDDLIKTSLRMRPDWIIVGEVRGGECQSMLQAMNTGHSGLSTGHANSVSGMLRRLEAMYLQKSAFPVEAIREQIVQGIDLIVHLGRIDGYGRKVLEIGEIQGLQDGKYIINSIFKFEFNKGLVWTGNTIVKREKLELAQLTLPF